MQKLAELMRAKAQELLASGKVKQVLAWRRGQFAYDNAPAVFTSPESCTELVYDEFCPANLSKYLLAASKKKIPTAVFLKPCDTYGVNQLIKDNRVQREFVHAIGTPCPGMLDIKKIRAQGLKGFQKFTIEGEQVQVETVYGIMTVLREAVLLDKCLMCKGNAYMLADEEIGKPLPAPARTLDPVAAVTRIEKLPPEERFAFWQKELSKCIRCNACRDICPACSCEQCIFDNQAAPVAGKAFADSVEESMFHIIRAYHVAGRCVGCGECARVCPQGVKLGLLNVKFMKDINTFYGKYQAGSDLTTPAPQVTFKMDDVEPGAANQKGRS